MPTDEEIMQEFSNLFGNDEPAPEPEPQNEPEPEPDNPEPQADPEPTPEPEPEPEPQQEPEPQPSNKEDKRNHAFAELRNQNKAQAQLIKQLGEAIGLGADTPQDVVAQKVQEVLLQKQSKEQGIPVETLREIQELRELAQQNKSLKLQQDTANTLTTLSNKYGLSSEELSEFTDYLIEHDKNPLVIEGVDIEGEFLKSQHERLVQKAVDKALQADKERRDKADKHAAGTQPGKSGSNPEPETINTVKELDAYFNSLEL